MEAETGPGGAQVDDSVGQKGPWPPHLAAGLGAIWRGGGWESPQPSLALPSEVPASLTAFPGPGGHMKASGASYELILW